jgi:hypothetical protein
MRFPSRGLFISMGLLLLVPVELLAQNVSAGTASHLTIGQQAVVQDLANNTSQGWFDFQARVGRSYCASVTFSQMSHFSAGMTQGDPVVTVYQSDGTTVVATNDDIGSEPDADLQSRACFIWPTGSTGFIKATQLSTTLNTYDVRIIETTMFCPWFFISGDYNAFTLIRNTTDSAVNYTVNWRNSSGAIVGTTSASLPGNGNIALNARTFVNPVTAPNGSVEIVHNGSEDALKASTTTLSATTGLGFDAMFEQRRSQ